MQVKRCVVEAARGSGIRATARNWQLPCLVQPCPARVVAETSGGRCQFRAAGRGQRSSAVSLCGVLRHQCDHQVGMAPLLDLAVKGARVSCARSGPPERRPHRRGAACRHCTYYHVWPLPCGCMCSRHGYSSGQTANPSAVLASVTSGCNRGRAPPAPCSPAREDASQGDG